MIARHHPSEELLAGFAAGTLDRGRHAVVAAHILGCGVCAKWARSLEHVGGVVLENLPPAAMSAGALESVRARLDSGPRPAELAPVSLTPAQQDVPGLPAFIRHYQGEHWKWVAPCLYLRPIALPDAGDTRVFLLKARAGTKLLPHSHSEMELTCVLTGSLSHEGGRFAVGDFDIGDSQTVHDITIGQEADCICLVAMRGSLLLRGVLGRLIQPLVSI